LGPSQYSRLQKEGQKAKKITSLKKGQKRIEYRNLGKEKSHDPFEEEKKPKPTNVSNQKEIKSAYKGE